LSELRTGDDEHVFWRAAALGIGVASGEVAAAKLDGDVIGREFSVFSSPRRRRGGAVTSRVLVIIV